MNRVFHAMTPLLRSYIEVCVLVSLKEHSREVLAQESADFTQGPLMSSCKHFCSYVNIFEVKQLADDVIILKLIVTSSFLR